MQGKFLIIVSGWNCKLYARDCIKSLDKLRNKNFEAVIVDDASTDGTWEEIKDSKYTTIRNKKNVGAAKIRYDVLKSHKGSPEDVVIFLGLDDELTPNALDILQLNYKGDTLLTYGNWKNEKGRRHAIEVFPPKVIRERSYRNYKFISTAPNTFKYKLFKHLSEDDFKINGKWIENCTDVAFMWPLLELAGSRIKMIPHPIYLYNQYRPQNTLQRLGGGRGKKAVLDHLRLFPKRIPFAE